MQSCTLPFHDYSKYGYCQHYGFLLCALVSLGKLSGPRIPVPNKKKQNNNRNLEIKDKATQKVRVQLQFKCNGQGNS